MDQHRAIDQIILLVDRTNGHPHALTLQHCVRLSVVTICIVAKPCVLEQKLLLTGSRIWEIDWYQNEWPWPLHRGRLRSCQPLCHIRHWIYRKLLEREAWFQRTINRKWPMRNRMATSPMTSHDVTRWPPKGQTRDPNTLGAQCLENSWAGDAV